MIARSDWMSRSCASARPCADEMRSERVRIFPDFGPGQDEQHRTARALRDDLQLDPAVALSADAIARHPPVARDRVDQIVWAPDHHHLRFYLFVVGFGRLCTTFALVSIMGLALLEPGAITGVVGADQGGDERMSYDIGVGELDLADAADIADQLD